MISSPIAMFYMYMKTCRFNIDFLGNSVLLCPIQESKYKTD